MHNQGFKFGGKINKFGGKSFKKLNSTEFMEFVFFKSERLLGGPWLPLSSSPDFPLRKSLTLLYFQWASLSWLVAITASDQRIVIFPANRNRNRNRFAELTSVRIGIGIVCELQSLRIRIGIIFVRWEVSVNNSRIPKIYFFSKNCQKNSFSWLLYIFYLKNLPGKLSHNEIYAYSLYIYSI